MTRFISLLICVVVLVILAQQFDLKTNANHSAPVEKAKQVAKIPHREQVSAVTPKATNQETLGLRHEMGKQPKIRQSKHTVN